MVLLCRKSTFYRTLSFLLVIVIFFAFSSIYEYKKYISTTDAYEEELTVSGLHSDANTKIEQLVFTLRLASSLLRGNATQGNVLFSPIIIYELLVILYLGSAGQTHFELEQLLGVPNDNVDRILKFRNDVKDILEAITNSAPSTVDGCTPETALTFGTAVFITENIQPKKNFVNQVKEYFNTTIRNVDFRDTTSLKDFLNSWLRKNRIQKLSFSVNEATKMFVMGTIFFNATWINPFLTNNTNKEPFDTSLEIIDVQMMETEMSLPHYKNTDLNFEAIQMPYIRADLRLLIILPNPGTAIQKVLAQMTAQELENVMAWTKEKTVNVKLPRFKLHGSTFLLEQSMNKLGLTTLARDHNFKNISDYFEFSTRVQVNHYAEIEMNEMDAAELGAYVSLTTSTTTKIYQPWLFIWRPTDDNDTSGSINFHVNRVFLMYIYQTVKKYVLFNGIVYKPEM